MMSCGVVLGGVVVSRRVEELGRFFMWVLLCFLVGQDATKGDSR